MGSQLRVQRVRQGQSRPGASVGASPTRARKAETGAGTRRLWVRVSTVIVGGGLLASLVLWAEPMDYVKRLANRPITSISIEGRFHYLSQQKVQALVAERVSANFLQLDMTALKNSMEQNPWIDTVSIARQWPDRLLVRVEEQQPIARWGNDAFMNMRGDIVEVVDNSVLDHLPLLHGGDRYAREVMHKYVQIARLISTAELTLNEVHLDETRSWTLQLENGTIIRIGREQVFEKLQRLLDVYPTELAAKMNRIDTIDLRYDNGFAVAWNKTGLEQVAMAKAK
jgi:cell division protein FtsQ